MNLPQHIAVNEFFGPTIQGEGPDVGRACYFLRLHNCPVHCPGCDTAYTWNGSEQGKPWTYEALYQKLIDAVAINPYCGLVLSGGEPLIHYSNKKFLSLMDDVIPLFKWMGLETSGYAGKVSDTKKLDWFLSCFTSISVSPKITPCLHGRQTDEVLECNIPTFLSCGDIDHISLFFKFVVRDQADIDAVLACAQRHPRIGLHRIYLMPYGNDRNEILASVENLIPAAVKYGFTITPRLHSLLWGATRGK